MKALVIIAAISGLLGGSTSEPAPAPDNNPVSLTAPADQPALAIAHEPVSAIADKPTLTEPDAPTRLALWLRLLALMPMLMGAALAADRITDKKEGEEIAVKLAVAKVWRGGIVAINAAGFGKAAADVASERVAGVSVETVDNTGGAAGDKRAKVQGGIFRFAISGAFAQADVGKRCFVIDDQTVSVATIGNGVVAGRIAEFISATEAWVKIDLLQVGRGVTDADAGGAYTAAEQALINKLKSINNLHGD